MNKNIFLTGGTGLLGLSLTEEILRNSTDVIYALVRGKTWEESASRLFGFLDKNLSQDILRRQVRERIVPIRGDIIDERLGIDREQYNSLCSIVNTIYHCAAITDFAVDKEKAKLINIDGTQNVINFALKCLDKGVLELFNHASSIAVAGTFKGVFKEEYFNEGQKFNNHYERSKFEAEKLVREYMKLGMPSIIFRPSLITGHSITGKTTNFKMLYQPLHFWANGIFTEMPTDGSIEYNLVPIDYVAKAMYHIAQEPRAFSKSFHIISKSNVSINFILQTEQEYFNFKPPRLISISKFHMESLTAVQRLILKPYIDYFNNYFTTFDSTNTDSIIRDNLEKPEANTSFMNVLFKFCETSGFIKRKQEVKI